MTRGGKRALTASGYRLLFRSLRQAAYAFTLVAQ